jgi:DNA polymerase elongation subunit (family B)
MTDLHQQPSAFEFQVLTWHGRDRESADQTHVAYQIDAYGRTADGKSVCLHVAFTPFFFVSTEGRSPTDIENFISAIKTRFGEKQQAHQPHNRRQQQVHDDYKHPQLVEIKKVSRKRFYGFTNGAQETFLLLRFKSLKALRAAALFASDKCNLELFESRVPPELRLLHIRKLPSVGWVRCDKPLHFNYHGETCTTCDIEYNCNFTSLAPVEGRADNAPLVVASFDIECISKSGGFPMAHDIDSPIIQIATTFWRITEPAPYKRHLACLGSPDPLEGVHVDACKTESELLMAWVRAVRAETTDIMLGYNIWGFDFKYIYERSVICGAKGFASMVFPQGAAQKQPAISTFLTLLAGKRTDMQSELQQRKLESSAYGSNEFYIPTTPGVLQLDLLVVMKKEHKLASYKLDAVAERFLGDRKVDLPIKEMFALYKEGSPAALHKIAEYCVKDTELPIEIMRKLAILPSMMEMAKAVHVPMDYLLARGQQIKVFSVILKKAREEGYVCPTNPQLVKSDKYTGATVLEAKTGAYFGCIACLDFASLYPSIIRAHNMCHSTLVINDARYGNLPGVEYELIDLGEGMGHAKFATSYKGSILPSLLSDLAEYRKQARKEQKQAIEQGNMFLAELLNAKQLAYKVTMNSLYGFCGASNGLLPCYPIAAAVTTVGRSMIAKTRDLIKELYQPAEVVYGDSVAGHTPVLVRVEGLPTVMSVEELSDLPCAASWQPCAGGDGKESCELLHDSVEAWTEDGWTTVQRIIRHSYSKDLVRVMTHSGLVDVTHDHSLLLENGSPIKPSSVVPGVTRLLHAPLPPTDMRQTSLSVPQARIMGMYFAGSRSCRLSQWALTAKSRDLLVLYKALCEKAYPGQAWSIYQTLDSSAAAYSLFPFGPVGQWVDAYDEITQDNKVPSAILFGPPQIRAAFMHGMRECDDTASVRPTVSGYWSATAHSQVSAMTLVMLGKSLGYDTTVLLGAANNAIDIEFCAAASAPPPTTVKKMQTVPCTPYVYDLTTSNHHFHAGVGNIIVHNTDSVMCDFGTNDMAEVFRLGEEAAQRITAEFKHPIELEFEKVMSPFLLFSKKRYASLKFTSPSEPGKVDAKGISLVRRDSCELVKQVFKQVLDLILYSKDREAAADVIHTAARSLLAGEVPMAKLVMSKALRGSYNSEVLQPHDVVRAKIAARSPAEEPRPGDRVEFVYTEMPELARQNVTCRAEDPAHAQEAGMLIDLQHYLSLLKSALKDTVEVMRPDLDSVFEDIGEEGYMRARKQRELHGANVRTGQKEITGFFAPQPRGKSRLSRPAEVVVEEQHQVL